jgi:uncharacterized membrane protein
VLECPPLFYQFTVREELWLNGTMKYGDVQKLHDAGLITAEQQHEIIEHFNLKEDGGNKFLAIVSFIGAILIASGTILVISAHWNDIPAGVKIAAGVALMLGAHGVGWWLREVRKDFPKVGEALHFAGSLLFLANIALVGQIYHLSSRPGNAFLLWWIGIAALPWVLRSAAQFALLLLGIGVWLGVEINDATSLIRCDDEHQLLVYAMLGLLFAGSGFLLRRSSNPSFSTVAEKLGLLAFAVFSYPLTWAGFLSWGYRHPELNQWLLPVLGILAALLVAFGCRNLTALVPQWRVTWGATLAGAAALLVVANWVPQEEHWYWIGHMTPLNTIAAIVFFAFCLLQVQAGLMQRSQFLVNLGITFIGLDIIATYIGLFGSMAFTGMMFIVSGVFLIVFGVFLEKKRRTLMKQMRGDRQTEIQSAQP